MDYGLFSRCRLTYVMSTFVEEDDVDMVEEETTTTATTTAATDRIIDLSRK